MLYRKKEEPKLSEALFQNPTSEYRGTPFWAWNCKVTEEQIDFQTEALKEMGMGGAHIHCRTGMNIPYMSEEFLNRVAYAHEKLKEKAFEEFKQELLHEESKEIDELVSYTYHDNGQRS